MVEAVFVQFFVMLIASTGGVDPKQIRYEWGKQPRLSHTNPHTLSEARQGTTERSYQRLNLIPPLLHSIAVNRTFRRHSLRSEIDRAAGRMKEYCQYKTWERLSSKVPTTNIFVQLVSTFASALSGRAPHASFFLSLQTLTLARFHNLPCRPPRRPVLYAAFRQLEKLGPSSPKGLALAEIITMSKEDTG